ncbi:MAG: hypothetical protein IJ083_05345 [Clostridia bacterium]|nr:hypothetical protein [Clostridia bacterium]
MRLGGFKMEADRIGEELPRAREEMEVISSDRAQLEMAGGMNLDDEILQALDEARNALQGEDARVHDIEEDLLRAKERLRGEIMDDLDKDQDALGTLQGMGDSSYAGSLKGAEQAVSQRIEALQTLLNDLEEGDRASDGGSAAQGNLGGFIHEHFMGKKAAEDAAVIQAFTDRLPRIEATIRSRAQSMFGSSLNQARFQKPLSDSVIYQTQDVIDPDGEGILGYNNGKKSYVAVGTGFELQTTVHESLHQWSSYSGGSGICVFSWGGDRNREMNEAITEMYTQDLLGSGYGPDYSAYSENRDAMRQLRSAMGDDVVRNAYFQGRPDLIQQELDRTLGSGTFGRLSQAFDDAMSSNAQIYYHGSGDRDTIIQDYILAKAKERARASAPTALDDLLSGLLNH